MCFHALGALPASTRSTAPDRFRYDLADCLYFVCYGQLTETTYSVSSGAFGRRHSLPDRQEERVHRIRGKGRLSIGWTHPGVEMRDANGNPIFLVRKGRWTPLFLRVVFATQRSWFGCHN